MLLGDRGNLLFNNDKKKRSQMYGFLFWIFAGPYSIELLVS